MRCVLAAVFAWACLLPWQGLAEGATSDGRAPEAEVWEAQPVGGELPAAAPEEAAISAVDLSGERVFETVDGVAYYHGNPNYPVWSMGNRVGAVADLSSAYISEADDRWRLIGFLSFPVVLRGKDGLHDAIPLEDELRECFFWQRVRDGSFFFNRDGRPLRRVEGAAFACEARAYRMIFDAAVENMGELFELPDGNAGKMEERPPLPSVADTKTEQPTKNRQ